MKEDSTMLGFKLPSFLGGDSRTRLYFLATFMDEMPSNPICSPEFGYVAKSALPFPSSLSITSFKDIYFIPP